MRPAAMPSSLFQMRRHTRRPPPTCKSSWREGRIPLSPLIPNVLTGWVRWIDTTPTPPVDIALTIDVYAQAGPTEYFGITRVPGAQLTLSILTNADPTLYDVLLELTTPTWTDGDSWHDLPRPSDSCLWDTGILSHIYVPDTDANYAMLSL